MYLLRVFRHFDLEFAQNFTHCLLFIQGALASLLFVVIVVFCCSIHALYVANIMIEYYIASLGLIKSRLKLSIIFTLICGPVGKAFLTM